MAVSLFFISLLVFNAINIINGRNGSIGANGDVFVSKVRESWINHTRVNEIADSMKNRYYESEGYTCISCRVSITKIYRDLILKF